MKRSRIFLGVTTALLAIAGVAAAKAHRAPSVTVYYLNDQLAVPQCYTVVSSKLKYTALNPSHLAQGTVIISGQSYFLYTNPTCKTPAYYNAQ